MQGKLDKEVYLDSLLLVVQQASISGCLQTCVDALGFCFNDHALLKPYSAEMTLIPYLSPPQAPEPGLKQSFDMDDFEVVEEDIFDNLDTWSDTPQSKTLLFMELFKCRLYSGLEYVLANLSDSDKGLLREA